MSKRSGVACEEWAAQEKMKQTAMRLDDAKAEIFHSRYRLSEIFDVIPIPLVEVLLDFLDIRHATRLCGVSPTWKEMLVKGPIRNHKTAVLQQPSVGHKAFKTLCDTLGATRLWESDLLSLKPKSIEHFIFIGHFSEAVIHLMCKYLYKKDKRIISKSLNKITFCEDDIYMMKHWTMVPASVKYVNFVNCTFLLYDSLIELSAEDEFSAASGGPSMNRVVGDDDAADDLYEGPFGTNFGIVWNLKVFAPRLELDRFVHGKELDKHCTFRKLDDSKEMDKNCVCMKLDEKNLIWPYPEEQVQWLLKTWKGLKGTVAQSSENTDKQWTFYREVHEQYHGNCYRKFDLISRASYDEGDWEILDTLDLAFLGRLFVCMNKAKVIPGFEPPPFEFPDDFQYGGWGCSLSDET